MPQNLPWLYAGRALRSFATAFLTVAFPLYLAALGYNATRIGLVLTAAGVVTIGLVAGVGLAADRWGRRRVIMALAALAAAGNLALTFSGSFWVMVLASGLGGVGRGGGAGSGGSWGPVFPAEQPLLANAVPPARRTYVFGAISFVGVLAGAGGSLVAALPAYLHSHGWPWLAAYRSLFVIGFALSTAMVITTVPVREAPPRTVTAGPPSPLPVRQLVGRLGLTNALNGLSFGFLGPLLTYWFYRRYGAGPAELGVLYTMVNLVSALPYLWSARIADHLGAVKTVVATRAVAVVTLAAMAFMPSFWWAGVAYMVRMIFNSMGMPARQSYVMGVSDDRYRSRVAAFGALPSQITGMITPAVGGALMDSFLNVPIFGGAFFMACNLVAYWYAFRNVPPPEERQRSAEQH